MKERKVFKKETTLSLHILSLQHETVSLFHSVLIIFVNKIGTRGQSRTTPISLCKTLSSLIFKEVYH